MRRGSDLEAGTGAACEQLSDRTGHPSTGKPSPSITAAVIAEIADTRAREEPCKTDHLPMQRRLGRSGAEASLGSPRA
jgi:hypothetical protein